MNSYIHQVIEKEKPDVVSCHNLAGWSVSAWDALAKHNLPIVQALHDQYLLCLKSSMFRGQERCLRQCGQCRLMRSIHPAKSNQVRAVIGVSHFILDKLLSFGYFRQTPIRRVIHNARSLPVDRFAGRKDASNYRIIFGFLGTLTYIKGIELLVDSFIACSQPAWHLIIAGTGKTEYELMLKNRCANHSNIEFVGYCRPQEYFARVDINIVPSLWEDTFPGVVFESLLFGVPVIGSRRGGIFEMIQEGENGMAFDPDFPEGLCHCMQTMAKNIDQWRSRREVIQQNAIPYGDEREWTMKWIDLFHEVIDNPSERISR